MFRKFRSTRRRSQSRGICEIIECCVHAGSCIECCGNTAGGAEVCCYCSHCPGCPSCSSSPAAVQSEGAVTAPDLTPSILCPACGTNMAVVKLKAGISVDECPACCGLWLDHGELETLSAMTTPPKRLLIRKEPAVQQVRPEGTRPCPHCAEPMTVTTVKGTRLDLCPVCKGLFLDQGELNRLLGQ